MNILKLIGIFLLFFLNGCQKNIDPPESLEENVNYIIEHHYNEEKKTYTSLNIPILEIDGQKIPANGRFVIDQINKVNLFY